MLHRFNISERIESVPELFRYDKHRERCWTFQNMIPKCVERILPFTNSNEELVVIVRTDVSENHLLALPADLVGIQITISQEQELIGSLEGFELKLNTIIQGRCKVF